MKELLIDVGNSRCKYACVEDHRIKLRGALTLNHLDEMSDVVQRCGTAAPEVAYMISVASHSTNSSVADAVAQYFGHTPILLNKKMPVCGLRSDYEATQLGIDRVAVMVAAWQRLKQACIVMDFGTAVTIDLIDDEGVHKGGVILPSNALMRSSLSKGTAQLNDFDDTDRAYRVLATNTEDAIASGCGLMLTASVSHIVQEMQAQFACDIPVLATGGGVCLSDKTNENYATGGASLRYLSIIPTLSFEGMMALIEAYYE